MNKRYYIYKITFLKGSLKGKYYIGKHIGKNPNLVNDGYFGSGKICNDYYKKYSAILNETITKEILEICSSKEELAEREKFWIGDLWKTDEMCVNMKCGGAGGWGIPSEETKNKLKTIRKGHIVSEETKHKISLANSGTKHYMYGKPARNRGSKASEETLKKLSIAAKGRKHTDEAKQKIAESSKNRKATLDFKWINNGVECKFLSKTEIYEYITKGWVFGRLWQYSHSQETKNKMSKSRIGHTYNKDRKWINNGIQSKNVKLVLLDQYLSDGWVLGRLPFKKKAA